MANESSTQQDPTTEQPYSQGQFDQVFSQMTSGQPDAIREAWQAYFDLADQTLRTARRVSEIQTLGLMKDQIVQEVSQRVLHSIQQQNPQVLSPQKSSSSR